MLAFKAKINTTSVALNRINEIILVLRLNRSNSIGSWRNAKIFIVTRLVQCTQTSIRLNKMHTFVFQRRNKLKTCDVISYSRLSRPNPVPSTFGQMPSTFWTSLRKWPPASYHTVYFSLGCAHDLRFYTQPCPFEIVFLSFDLNEIRMDAGRMDVEMLFQHLGPAIEKARSPKQVFDFRTFRSPLILES